MKNIFERKKLIGVDEIMAFANWTDPTTVMDRRIAYSEHCPIRKEGGVLVVEKRKFIKWLKEHPDAAKEIIRPPFELIQTRKVKLRWGRERIEQRRIIY